MTGDEIEPAEKDATTGDGAVKAADKAGGSESGNSSREDRADALKKLAAGENDKALLEIAGHISRTTIGPDPETAGIMAEVEKHNENVKLEGFKQHLANRDKQNQRDHEFRLRILRHQSVKDGIVIAVSVLGLILGLYLSVTDDESQLGGYVLVASLLAFLQAANLKPRPGRGED